MKALVLYGPGDYRVEKDWKLPEPEPGWALVRVAYAGICGSDIPRFFTTGSYHAPMIIGHEFSGVVERPAEGGKVPAGTPVAILPIIPCGSCEGCLRTHKAFHCAHYRFIGSRDDGGFAEYAAVPDGNLFPLDSVDELRKGALIEPFSVALHVLRRSGMREGRAVVFGAGPIGLAVALWLRFEGRAVTLVDVRDFSLSIARRMGLKALPFAELPRGEAFDAAFEASGSTEALLRAIEVTRDLGSVTVVGRSSRDTQIPLGLFERMMRKELTLQTCWGYDLEGEEETLRAFFRACEVEPMISHRVPLDAVPELLEKVVRPRGEYCKILIDMGGGGQ